MVTALQDGVREFAGDVSRRRTDANFVMKTQTVNQVIVPFFLLATPKLRLIFVLHVSFTRYMHYSSENRIFIQLDCSCRTH
mmetsp:Transcript_7987/g.11627  ORF Transcript_7987/g.11627 Transcript_7987/m.11627 type:complete len:81 (-) Transcript_7987:726-968(-)